MGNGSAGHHAEDGNRGVAVAGAGQNQLAQRAAAQQYAAPAYDDHAQEVPKVCAVGNGLALEAQLEGTGSQITHQGNGEDGDEAIEQLEVLEHDGITDAAGHAQTALLSQSAHDQRDDQCHKDGSVLGAGAGLTELEQGRNQQEQQEQAGEDGRQHSALCLGSVVSALQGETGIQEPGADEDTHSEADGGGQSIQITACQTQDHTQGTAQEHQGTDHHQRAQYKADSGGGTGLGPELPGGNAHDKGTHDQTYDLGTDILHHSSTVHTAGAYDVPKEAGNAEAHVGGVAKGGQQDGCQTDSAAGQNNEPVYFFHFGFRLSFFFLNYLDIIEKNDRKSKSLFRIVTEIL